jgi:TRAP-type C4-dicarboxylate transport system permease small subunit
MSDWAAGLARLLDRLLSHLLGATLATLVVLDSTLVVLRYQFGIGVAWGGDVGILLLMALAWLGLPLLWLRCGHIAMDVVSGAVSPRLKRVAAVVLQVLFGAASIALAIVGFDAMEAFSFIDMPSLPMSQAIKIAPIVSGAVLGAAAAALRLCEIAAGDAGGRR